MARNVCDKCGASWHSESGDKCPYCGTVCVKQEKSRKTEQDYSNGTTIINNYYGEINNSSSDTRSAKINDRGEPVGLNEKELKVYYQPRPKVVWLAILIYIACISIICLVVDELGDFEEVFIAIAGVVISLVPCAIYWGIKKYQQVRWDRLHERVRQIRKENSNE